MPERISLKKIEESLRFHVATLDLALPWWQLLCGVRYRVHPKSDDAAFAITVGWVCSPRLLAVLAVHGVIETHFADDRHLVCVLFEQDRQLIHVTDEVALDVGASVHYLGSAVPLVEQSDGWRLWHKYQQLTRAVSHFRRLFPR